MTDGAPFRFVQFEFAFSIGPPDGRYLRRSGPGGDPRQVIVLRTLGATPRRFLKSRRPSAVTTVEPASVPTVRATLIDAEPLAGEAAAHAWLEEVRRKSDRLDVEVDAAATELGSFLRAHRAAAADPYVRELAAASATVVRVGYGTGDLVAEGRFGEAYELPELRERRRRTDVLAPQERLAAILSGRDEVLVSEELVLRARTDLLSDRPREAALQARIALETLLSELPSGGVGDLVGALEADRAAIGQAANAALVGDLEAGQGEQVAASVGRMRQALAVFSRSAREDSR